LLLDLGFFSSLIFGNFLRAIIKCHSFVAKVKINLYFYAIKLTNINMLGTILGSGINLVANGIGSWLANKRQREANEQLDAHYAKQIGELDKEINSNYLDRADSRNALRKLTDANTEAMRQLNTSAIRGGATDEAKVAMASQLNKRTADVVGDLAAIGEQHKDSLRQQKRVLESQHALTKYKRLSDQSGIDKLLAGIGTAAQAIGGAWGTPQDATATATTTSTPATTTSGVEAATNVANSVIANNPAIQTILDPTGKAVRDALGDNQFKYGQTM
jgi:hypothetical protein